MLCYTAGSTRLHGLYVNPQSLVELAVPSMSMLLHEGCILKIFSATECQAIAASYLKDLGQVLLGPPSDASYGGPF